MSAETRINELGIRLPEPMRPAANYVPAVRTGNLLFLSGAGPIGEDGRPIRGKLGDTMSVDGGQAAARLVALQLLAVLRQELGSLDRVQRIVKLLCMVNATEDFGQQPQVANGASDLFVEVFGEAGRHARSAVGMASLPMGIPVEIEMIVEVAD
ncbi:MAG: RidA family protein [Dehalococcoidia bacterium]